MQIFMEDKDIAAELGLAFEKWEAVAPILETRGLPKRDAVFEDKRCWPAVVAFFMHRAGAPDPFGMALRTITEQQRQANIPPPKKRRGPPRAI